ncbi:type II toxin-antitoxin system RelE/ParE family toxin [Aromatoleum toluolicum]|uniref:type II toxin-antitoxin system RelE family toxin n=1 Tax=Aromatoleum toluolicum TaxID=90060 RepID=UPI001FE8EBC7|nr:type II toxin-antitoxin system RelE/ParE family toxin [Aromatoleum toluolicum]NMG00481.2 type II toxin-antitoxin system RelE/ParE family toxin [Aromatoleum toluolicum]
MRAIPRDDVSRLLARAELSRDISRPPESEKLSRHELYRVRQGSYRIVYSIDDGAVVVDVIKIGHRREIYRGL